jgi:hypothetical protein
MMSYNPEAEDPAFAEAPRPRRLQKNIFCTADNKGAPDCSPYVIRSDRAMTMIRMTSWAIAATLIVGASSFAWAEAGNPPSAKHHPQHHAQQTTRHHGQQAAARKPMIDEAQAKREIELDGYTNVQDVKKSQAGWTATAKEGDHSVTVLVDELGGVRKEAEGSMTGSSTAPGQKGENPGGAPEGNR